MEKSAIPSWAAALGRVSSGLYILTIRSARGETGFLASWVQQCSFSPPLVTVAVRSGRYILDWLEVGQSFALNIVPEGNKQLLIHFGKGFDINEPAFDGIELREFVEAPVIVSAAAFLILKVREHHPVGDHVLVIGEVELGEVLNDAKPASHSRKNGTHY